MRPRSELKLRNAPPGLLRSQPASSAPAGPPAEEPVRITRPVVPPIPLIVCSPHSGRNYTPDFLQRARLPLDVLRAGEDFHVDTLIATAPDCGATLISATFPRVVCDVNRASLDLDPRQIENGEEAGLIPSEKGAAGLGSVPVVVSGGRNIYAQKLTAAEAASRLRCFWHPYHTALRSLITEMKTRYGFCLVLDMHSMPPGVEGSKADVVLGDRYGASAEPAFVQSLSRSMVRQGLCVARNHPFAGGYITSHYGRPAEGVSLIQVEMNRALYTTVRSGGSCGLDPKFSEKIAAVILDMAAAVTERMGAATPAV